MYIFFKIAFSAFVLVLVSELSKKSTLLAGVMASLPLVSLLAFLWLYAETKDTVLITKLSTSIFWLVLPSLVLFVSLPLFLKAKWHFFLSLGASITLTVLAYYFMIVILEKFGVKL